MINAGELLSALKLAVRSAAFCGWAHVELTLQKTILLNRCLAVYWTTYCGDFRRSLTRFFYVE